MEASILLEAFGGLHRVGNDINSEVYVECLLRCRLQVTDSLIYFMTFIEIEHSDSKESHLMLLG